MDELCHYGIKGQKWGVRRFQNSDGSYTSEGKRRAQQQEKKDPVKEMKDEDLRKAINRLSLENKYKDLTKKPTPPSKLESTKKAVDATSELVNRAKKMDQDSRKAAKKERMDLSKKTDKELRDQINRELLERQYNDLFAKESVSKGRRYLSDVLDNAGTVLAVGSSALSIALAIQQLQKKAGYSDIMDYLHGQTMRAILEDDPEYFYEGRFTVNAWKSEKDWSRLIIDYDVGPYKWKNLSSIDNWLWDPFNFQNGVIQAALFRNIAVTTEMKEIELDAVMYGRAPVCPRFIVQSSEGRGVHVRFVNRQLSIDLTKLLPEGTIQIPEFILFGDYGGTIYLWVDEGTGTVSVDFRQGRL